MKSEGTWYRTSAAVASSMNNTCHYRYSSTIHLIETKSRMKRYRIRCTCEYDNGPAKSHPMTPPRPRSDEPSTTRKHTTRTNA